SCGTPAAPKSGTDVTASRPAGPGRPPPSRGRWSLCQVPSEVEAMNAPEITTPVMRPYLPATTKFMSGEDSPRAFLERCLAALDACEPAIGAFVTLNLAAARLAADESTGRRRAGKPPCALDRMPISLQDTIQTIHIPTPNCPP